MCQLVRGPWAGGLTYTNIILTLHWYKKVFFTNQSDNITYFRSRQKYTCLSQGNKLFKLRNKSCQMRNHSSSCNTFLKCVFLSVVSVSYLILWLTFPVYCFSASRREQIKKDKVGGNWNRQRKWMEINITKKLLLKCTWFFSLLLARTNCVSTGFICSGAQVWSKCNSVTILPSNEWYNYLIWQCSLAAVAQSYSDVSLPTGASHLQLSPRILCCQSCFWCCWWLCCRLAWNS